MDINNALNILLRFDETAEEIYRETSGYISLYIEHGYLTNIYFCISLGANPYIKKIPLNKKIAIL